MLISEKVDHESVKLYLKWYYFLVKFYFIVLLIFQRNQTRNDTCLLLHFFRQEIYYRHKITNAVEIVGNLNLGEILHLNINKLLNCVVLGKILFKYLLFGGGNDVFRLGDFSFSFHYVEHSFLVLFFILLLCRGFLKRNVLRFLPTIKIGNQVIFPHKVEVTLYVIFLLLKFGNRNSDQIIFFRIKIVAGFD